MFDFSAGHDLPKKSFETARNAGNQVQPQDIRPAAGRFVFGQALGKGQSSQVLEVTDTISGRRDLVAKLSDKHELLQEAMVLKALQDLQGKTGYCR